MNRKPRCLSLLLMAAATTVFATAAQAQAVRGTITNPQSGAAIDGAIVVLLDAQGASLTQVLSNNSGRFLLRAPGPGTYALRADRIGHASTYSETFEVAGTQTVVMDLLAEVEAIQLAGIDVDTERRCVRQPTDDGGTALLWEEARKALTAAAWTSESGAYRYELLHRKRQLDRDARRVVRESTRRENALRQQAFVAMSGEALAENGYVTRDADGAWLYNAPDAAVLLSDSFLQTHCFSVKAGRRDSEGLIGLTFEPIPDRHEPDVDGTLWLDPVTAELQWLDFRYRNLESGILDDVIGGRVEFQSLPSGHWFVSRWAIRMPMLERLRVGADRFALVGVNEQGAEVIGVRDSRGAPVLDFETGIVIGAVRSEFGLEGLGAARVFVVGSDQSVYTDDGGRFRLAGLAEGRYTVSYEHPSVDSIGFVPEPIEVDVTIGRAATVSFEAPSRYTTLTARCTPEDMGEGLAMLLGYARDLASGLPLPGAKVRVKWSKFRVETTNAVPAGRGAEAARRGGGGIQNTMVMLDEREHGYETQSDERGFYLFCGVPDNHPLRVSGEWMDVAAREIQIRIDPQAFYRSYDVEMRTNPGR